MQLTPVSSKTVQDQLVQNSFFGDLIGSYEKSDGGSFENKISGVGSRSRFTNAKSLDTSSYPVQSSKAKKCSPMANRKVVGSNPDVV